MRGFGQSEPRVVELNVIVSSVAEQKEKLENVTVVFHNKPNRVATLNKRGEFVCFVLENTKQLIIFKKKQGMYQKPFSSILRINV